jgi:hypothetical protein
MALPLREQAAGSFLSSYGPKVRQYSSTDA